MPKGKKNIVHDEQIWRDHIKVCFKVYCTCQVYCTSHKPSE